MSEKSLIGPIVLLVAGLGLSLWLVDYGNGQRPSRERVGYGVLLLTWGWSLWWAL